VTALGIVALLAAAVAAVAAQTIERPRRAVTDPGVITTRQTITPAGVQTVFQGRVYGVAFGGSSSELLVLTVGQVYRMDWRGNRVVERVAFQGSAGLQGILHEPGGDRALVAAALRQASGAAQVTLLEARSGSLRTLAVGLGGYIAGGPGVAGGIAAVPLIAENRLAVIDLKSGRVLGKAPTGIAPWKSVRRPWRSAQPQRGRLRSRFRSALESRRSSNTWFTSSKRIAPTIRSSAIWNAATGTHRW